MQLNLKTDLITSLKFDFFPPNKGDYIIKNGRLIRANPNLYLQSTGTQYIDTGVYGSGKTTFDIKYDMSATSNSSILFGSRYAYFNRSLCLFAPPTYRFDYGNVSPGAVSSSSGEMITTIEESNYIIKGYNSVGDLTTDLTTTVKTFTTPDTLKLFTGSSNGTISSYASAKVYYFKIYEDGVLVRHFVPLPKDLVIGNFTCPSNGMFDIVNQEFYANQGTGDFTYDKGN